MKTGFVKVYDIDLDGLTMSHMSFWDQFCPKGTRATQIFFDYNQELYDESTRTFIAHVDWEEIV